MLRMVPHLAEFPTTTNDALRLLEQHGTSAKLCAGGTDLIPNLKHELLDPVILIHIKSIKELCSIEETPEEVLIVPTTTLHQISQSEIIQKHCPGLAKAAAHVAGPQHRQMGTIGGNLALDTRCLFYNQTYFWRESIGFCLKKDGTACHVVKSGKRCVAAASNDTATMLLCLDALLDIKSASKSNTIALRDFYQADGIKNNILTNQDLIVQIRIPKLADDTIKRLEGFYKLRFRKSIDYPILSIGVRFDVTKDLIIRHAAVTINGLAAKPKSIQTDWLNSKVLDEQNIEELALYTKARCTPLINICGDTLWRKDMIYVGVKEACHFAAVATAWPKEVPVS